MLCAGGMLTGAAFHTSHSVTSDIGWEEIAWPFPRDAWPKGRAFRCTSGACGRGVELYVRPKIGFCNCATGVAGDEEIDRVTDLDLLSERFSPAGAGREIAIDGLFGRARLYIIRMPDGSARSGLGMAVSRRCDLVVALLQGENGAPEKVEGTARALLSSPPIKEWLASMLGGGGA